MGLTATEAEEFRQSILQKQKELRNPRVEWVVSKASSIEDVQRRFKLQIEKYPENTYVGIYVLDIITNDWDEPDRKKINADVKEILTKKYENEFPDADLEEAPASAGNQGIAFKLTMRLS